MEDNKQTINDVLKEFADSIGVAAGSLWSMYVKEYVVRGCIMVLVALVFFLLYMTFTPPLANWYAWRQLFLIPIVISTSVGLRLILNPGYHALNELTQVVSSMLKRDGVVTYGQRVSSRY